MNLLPDGGRPVGPHLEGNDYPLVLPSTDIAGLLADFYLSHTVTEAVLPLRLDRVRSLCGPAEACSSLPSSSDSSGADDQPFVVVVDAADQIVFDGRLADTFRAQDWGPRLHLLEWKTATAVCRVLVHRGWAESEQARLYRREFSPVRAVLDERTCEVLPRRVRRLRVGDTVLDGAVTLRNGHNTTLVATAPRRNLGRRAAHRIVLSAAPGSGLGRYDDCTEVDPPIRRINGVGPDNRGRFQAEAKDCYRLERTVVSGGPGPATVEPSQLQLHNNCLPCCECQDFENTYQGVRRLYYHYKDLGTSLGSIRDTFLDNRGRWLVERNCRHQKLVKLAGFALQDGSVSLVATLCNHTRHCRYDAKLELNFQHSRGETPTFDRGIIFVTDPESGELMPYRPSVRDNGSWPRIFYTWRQFNAESRLRLMLRLRFSPTNNPLDFLRVTAFPFLSGTAYPGDTLEMLFR